MSEPGGKLARIEPDERARARKVQEAVALMTTALKLLDDAGEAQAAISLSYAIHQAGGVAPPPPE